jgi:hypothetical protein
MQVRTSNNVWKITKRFTKHQTERHTPVIHGRRGLIYTPLDKAITIAEGEDQFQSNPEKQNFDEFSGQVRQEVAAFLQLQPADTNTPSKTQSTFYE